MTIYKATNTLNKYLPNLEYTQNKSDAELLIVGGKKFDLADFPKVRGVFKTGVGTDNLPLEEAKRRGIEIRLPSEDTRDTIYEETAAFTCNLLLRGLYTNIGEWATWTKRDRCMLARQRLLVLGAGRIGGRVAHKMKSFMEVTTFDSATDDESLLPCLISEADAVTIHIPLTSETRHFMNSTRLSWIKTGALLVNTARGSIVDEDALFEEISKGRLRAAFDVFWDEPYSGKLLSFAPERFMATPHVASACREFLASCARDCLAFKASLLNT
jgi:phosphoglycerate dehydrogenase-like enzyme